MMFEIEEKIILLRGTNGIWKLKRRSWGFWAVAPMMAVTWREDLRGYIDPTMLEQQEKILERMINHVGKLKRRSYGVASMVKNGLKVEEKI